MKKMIIISIVLMLGLSGSLLAQEQETVDVTATVQTALTLTFGDSLQFGNIAQGSSPYVDPTGVSHVDVSSPAVGNITISGQSGAGVNITVTNGTTNLGDGTNTMAFTADVKTSDVADQSNAAAISNPETLTGGSREVWIGGTLTVGGSQPAGAYSTSDPTNGGGGVVINVVYN